MYRIYFILLLLCLMAQTGSAQPPGGLRIATYNLSGYPAIQSQDDDGNLRLIADSIHPDILMVQGLRDDASLSHFLMTMFGSDSGSTFAATPFHDGRDSDNGVLYDTTKAELISAIYLPTGLRDIAEYIFAVRGTADTLHLFVVHLNGDQRPGTEWKRLAEINVLCKHIDSLPLDARYVIAGSFYFPGSREPAYQQLILSTEQNPRTVYTQDVLNGSISADWFNNPDYAYLMTHSTRGKGHGGPGGGPGGGGPGGGPHGGPGGMTGRFDMILLGVSVADCMVMDSYTVFGNDGRHFNDSINALPNYAVTPELAQALHDASDHLPVYLDLVFGPASGVAETTAARRRSMDLK